MGELSFSLTGLIPFGISLTNEEEDFIELYSKESKSVLRIAGLESNDLTSEA